MFSSLIYSVGFQSLPFIIAGIPALYYFAGILYTRFVHPLRNIPGPFWASVSRIWIGLHVSRGNADFVQRNLHKKYGPLVRIAPDEVAISDPAAIRIIYSVKSGFTKTDFYTPFAPNISPHGDHFAQLDERQHAERRRFVNGVYSMSTILESEAYINDCTNVFLSKMGEFAKTNQAIDLGEWIQWYTFDVIGELFFGHQFGFMKDEHDYGGYIRSLDTLLPGITLACVLPSRLRNIQQYVGLLMPSVREGIRGFDEIRAAGKYWVQARVDMMRTGKVGRADLLDKLFRIYDEKDDFDMKDIQNEACVAIFAGSDTTAIAIRSILYYLMKKPEVYEKLVEEIDKAYSDGRLSSPHITYAEAMKLPYLVACCKEGMRMHPSVGLGMPRHVPEGGKQICGRFFPAGTRVSVNAAVVHFDEGVFGSDAAEFNPDRWFGDSAANMDRYMLQFGAGSRTCIGKNISLAEIHKLVPQLLRSYRIELAEPNGSWKTQNFWFHKQTGIRVFVTRRFEII